MSKKKKQVNQPLEWYKLLLVLIGAFGIVLAIIHWYVSGVDIPNGLLTIFTLIISATLGPNALSSVADTIKNINNKHPEEEHLPIADINEEEETP